MNTNSQPSSAPAPGTRINGYTVKQVHFLPGIRSTFIHLVHDQTQANHIHLTNQDKENTFGVFFRTVPNDSTGVAHILEHTVLCGSEKFPVRDPFFSMLKRSLSTFMNAFTASDWTMYPFSTQSKKDYYHLMDVYLDAAFFPKIDRLSFKQEGHRMELVSSGSDTVLEYRGVVYNEMKGAMSSPSQVLGRGLLQGLYPDTTYSNNSGGEPEDIPSLTWEELKQFHSRYYHPSNAWFYTYGNLPLEESLSFISEKVLSKFDYLTVDSAVPSQPRWTEPKEYCIPYACSDARNIEKKYQGCVAWLTCDIRDHFEVLVLTILEQILMGNAGSPLRKALIDSNLGTALSDAWGFDADNRDTMFVAGLKDISQKDVETVKHIIFDTLTALAEQGIPPELVESAIHQIEFHKKEITNTPYPFGLKLLVSIAGTCIHEGDPVACLDPDPDLDILADKIKAGGFLEAKIQEYFLDNPHWMLCTLAPDADLENKREEKIKQQLSQKLSSLSDADLEQLQKDAKDLAALQDAEEDICVLPTLALEDVPPEMTVVRPDNVPDIKSAVSYVKATSDILYLTCPGGAGAIDPSALPLVPFFCTAFTNAGTSRHDYVVMAEKMDLYTGGISLSPFSGSSFTNENQTHCFLALHGKTLDRNLNPFFDLLEEFVKKISFHDHERLFQLLLQYQAGMESSIVAAGHQYAISMSSRHISRPAHIRELWSGMKQYHFIKKITGQMESGSKQAILEDLQKNMETMAAKVFLQNNLKPAVVGGEKTLVQADQLLGQMLSTLPRSKNPYFEAPEIDFDANIPREGWYTDTSVAFVGQSFPVVGIAHEDAPALSVIAKLLRSLYLHREIREKGGAYGGSAQYNSEEGIFSFFSYRDPHVARTLNVYKDACTFIQEGNFTKTDVTEAILQVCSDIDKPHPPGPAAIKAFYRDIAQLSDDTRQQFKDCLLRLDKDKIKLVGQSYFSIDDKKKGTCVIAAKDKLKMANETLEKQGEVPLTIYSAH